MSGSGHISQIGYRIEAPFIPDICMILLCCQGNIGREFIAKVLAKSCIDIQSLFATAGVHVIIRQQVVCFRIIIFLVTMVQSGCVSYTIIQSPSFA